MKKRLWSILLTACLLVGLLPTVALAADPAEQFPGLTPGETYWFDLSGADIPGDKNGSLPDDSLHWVPFTYAGTVNAYVLKSRSVNDDTAKGDSANAAGSTDPRNQIGYTYDHSLFIADYNVTSKANWNNLNGKNLIFGTAYTSGGVDYTLRTPSVGSGSTGSNDSERGTPLNNEWDAILDKANQGYQDNTVGYIKNWNGMDSWGQDTRDGSDPEWNRATRGSSTARSWQFDLQLSPSVGFRPVLELPLSDNLGSDGLTTVTLDLNGGSISSIAGTVNLAVKSDFNLTLPGVTDVTRPDGNDGTYFKWQDSSGNRYEPGAQVPANVGRLTALWAEPVTITGVAPAAGLIYNGQPQTGYTGTPTNAQGYNGDYTVTYSGRGGTAYDASPTAPSKAGDYAVAIAVPDSVQDFTGETTLNFTIAKAEITVTADDKTAYVGDTPPALTCTVTGLVNGETLKTQPELVYESGPDMSKAGTTAIKASGAEAPDGDNYDITYVDGTLTVSIRPSSGGGYTPPTYPPTMEQPEGGTVTVNPKAPKKGDTVTITPKPDAGYTVEQILVTDKNGNAVEVTNNGDGTYSFTQPAGKVNVKVTFMEDNSMLNFFVDVPADAYYYDAVLWAAENGITGGVDDTHFAPNATCTRAQIVTFLWRAAGSPVVNYAMNFSDVPADAYYAEAVRWAVSQGITKGTSDTTFSPDATCTRAQAMTFIYRSQQAQGGGMQGTWMFLNSFSDVDLENYYGEAVMWAVANGITNGTSDTTFSPGADCTRAQIVTFLWRFFVK